MNPTTPSLLVDLLQEWKQLLRNWASSGLLSSAAQEALQLDGEPKQLRELVGEWSQGDFSNLPPVVLQPSASMPGASGAYAISTGTIYLNADWLQGASSAQVLAVLTEELGHHLDGMLNGSDTPGDEGELFSALLHGGSAIVAQMNKRLQNGNDHVVIQINGKTIAVEAATEISIPIRVRSPGRTSGEVTNWRAFAALRGDGSVVTWGDPSNGGDSSGVASQLRSGVTQIFSNTTAFAALKADGSVITWGYPTTGGNSAGVAGQLSSGVVQIFSNGRAFAALKSNGSVITWGDPSWGGESNSVASLLSSGVTQIFSTGGTFAEAGAFAALKVDGSVVTWGNHPWGDYGGDSSGVSGRLNSGVVKIFSTNSAFAALKTDGSVVTWGAYGGDSSRVSSFLGSGVIDIFSTREAFAALKDDGTIVSWGLYRYGGHPGHSPFGSEVVNITTTDNAFAALRRNGSVATWGWSGAGGDSSQVADKLSSGIARIFSNNNAFAALKNDGSVVTWGQQLGNFGGNSSIVAGQLQSGVKQIFSTSGAFAALKEDGSVVAWGGPIYGGDSNSGLVGGVDISKVAEQLRSDVVQIMSNGASFAALKADGSVVTWGDSSVGGDSIGVASQLTNVVAFANPFTDDRLVLGGGGGTNNGSAAFAVSGILAPNNYLHAVLKLADPDGNGSFSYSWQSSSNGSTWTTVGSKRSSYRLTANDAGKQVRLRVTYKDGSGFNETVVTAAGSVAYSPSHEILEILAKDSVYEPTHTFGASILGQFGSPYTIDWILNGAAGLYALGLTAANAAPVLVLRGTSPTDVLDIWDDINPNGIGYEQFTQNITEIRNWLLTRSVNIPPVIVGHSLGGALAQWIAADATHNLNRRLGEVVTFNSPGIAPLLNFNGIAIGASTFKKELAGPITHYITSPDLVSLGGLKYIDGSATLVDYDASPFFFLGPHLDPVLVGELPISKLRSANDRFFSALPLSFLNSPRFGYLSDYDFVVRRLAISRIALGLVATGNIGLSELIFDLNDAIVSRASTESFRQSLGAIPASLLSALRFALDVPAIVAEMTTEAVQEGIASLKAGGAAAFEAAKSYTSQTWKNIASITAPKWRETRSWTSNAWRDTVSWTTDTWQAISGAAFNFAQPFITTAVKQVFRLPTTTGFLPFAAAATFEQSSAEDQASLGQPAALRSFSLASFDAPAAVQTIDVSVALSQASAELVTLQFQTVDRTAQAGVDYRALSGTLQFQPGETEKFVTIELLTPPQASGKDFALRLSNLQNAQFLASGEIVVSLLANQAPVVASAPADRFAPIEEPLFFALPADTFSDANSSDGDQLAYSASRSDGSPLPAWLQFDAQTLSFAGIPPASSLGSLAITITATDSAQSQASATFALMLVANDGAAAFTINGTPAVGNTLTATTSSADPDGNGAFSYSWQASTDSSTWSSIVGDGPSYTVTAADLGRELQLQVSYTDLEGFAELLTIPYGWLEELPATAAGTHFTVNDPLSPDLQITSQGSPDLLELEAAVSATLHARTNSTWSRGFVAYNAGSPTAPGTGERIPVTGLGRYSFVATAIPEATTAIVLEPDQNTAFFLHDTYSAFFSGLNLELDSYGRASAQRLLNIDRITMGSAGGTSIVDLTSPDYITGPMTVFGAARGTSIVWGSDADDSYISAGSDAVIYGGLGRNAYTLGSGRETMQYRQMSDAIGATDQIRGFDPNLDRLEFWSATDQQRSTPSLVNNLSSSLLAWGGHTIEFLDQPTLSLADLTILQATVM